MFLAALSFYGLFLLGYVLFMTAIIYHIKAFRPPGREGAIYVRILLILGVLLILLSLVAFIRVPWGAIKFL